MKQTSRSLENIDWSGFLARPRLPSPSPEVFDALYQTPMMIVGAGGSVGSALALRLSILNPQRLLLLEPSESNLYALQRRWKQAGASGSMIPVLGSAADRPLLDRLFAARRPRLVFHTALFRHVPLLEEQPLAAIHWNVFGTESLVQAAAAVGAHVVLLSTDKAVEPVSVMGATRGIAEQLVLASGGTVLRIGNVLASRDSVAEVFARQIAEGGPLTVTDPAARRYFLTLDEAVNLLLIAAAQPVEGALMAPRLPATHFISDLALFLARTLAPETSVGIEFSGLRSGDKETEFLWAESDATSPAAPEFGHEAMVYVEAPRLPGEQLGAGLANLHTAASVFDLTAALAHLRWLVPGYRPSPAVEELARRMSLPDPA
jgi:FlaA1/EpsC-like NDP-sugar epimerase